MGRFSNSFQLVKESLNVLKKDKELLWFPILSGIFTILIFASFLLPIFLKSTRDFAGGVFSSALILWVFLYYLLSYFIVIFFNTALITCANIRLNGGDPKVKDGLKNAFGHFFPILIWALISATIGLILRQIEERVGIIGQILVALVGIAWSIITYFVIPVMVFENVNPFKSIKKSAILFKKTWGENLIINVTAGLFFAALFFAVLIPAVLIALLSGSLYVIIITAAILILYFVILAIISSALSGIFTTALYNYASTGKVPKAFSPELIQGAFKSKKATHKLV